MTWGATNLVVRLGGSAALGGVSLDAVEGRVTAVVGGDGAGKTTLLRVLVGALGADAGEVRRPEQSEIGYLPSGSGTYADLTVEENLEFSAMAYGISSGIARSRSEEYLDRTGLAEARARLAGDLSGGMRQKLGVIRAMLHRPELLVLDEPTTGVDPVSRADLWWLIARAAADGAAVVLSTTYVDEAERAAWVLLLDSGLALAQGSPADIVGMVPGGIRSSPTRPQGEEASRSWRRGTEWRIWDPDAGEEGGVPSAPGTPIAPDLDDAVVVSVLQRELASPGTRGPGR